MLWKLPESPSVCLVVQLASTMLTTMRSVLDGDGPMSMGGSAWWPCPGSGCQTMEKEVSPGGVNQVCTIPTIQY